MKVNLHERQNGSVCAGLTRIGCELSRPWEPDPESTEFRLFSYTVSAIVIGNTIMWKEIHFLFLL